MSPKIEIVSRQGLENKASINALEPISKGHHSLNKDLFEKLGAIQIELTQVDEEFRKLSDDLHGESDSVQAQISKLTIDGATMKNDIKGVTSSMDGLIDAIRSDTQAMFDNKISNKGMGRDGTGQSREILSRFRSYCRHLFRSQSHGAQKTPGQIGAVPTYIS